MSLKDYLAERGINAASFNRARNRLTQIHEQVCAARRSTACSTVPHPIPRRHILWFACALVATRVSPVRSSFCLTHAAPAGADARRQTAWPQGRQGLQVTPCCPQVRSPQRDRFLTRSRVSCSPTSSLSSSLPLIFAPKSPRRLALSLSLSRSLSRSLAIHAYQPPTCSFPHTTRLGASPRPRVFPSPPTLALGPSSPTPPNPARTLELLGEYTSMRLQTQAPNGEGSRLRPIAAGGSRCSRRTAVLVRS